MEMTQWLQSTSLTLKIALGDTGKQAEEVRTLAEPHCIVTISKFWKSGDCLTDVCDLCVGNGKKWTRLSQDSNLPSHLRLHACRRQCPEGLT